ncbi:MAG: ribonuclease HII [Patescibacteria group bacterium]|nr:ribonuclease HII [Patescibacteria group bacterium]
MPTLEAEQEIKKSQPHSVVAGIDEAGRGAWAGPVVASAVVLPDDLADDLGINDSKQLTPIQREEIFEVVNGIAKDIGVGIAEVDEVDKLGVAQATYVAMQRAVEGLKRPPTHILVDGFKVNFKDIQSIGIIDGDAKSLSIAAASVVAKVIRDKLMVEAHKRYPRFGFAIHKGYGTKLHQERIQKHGICGLHRKSFEPVRQFLKGEPLTKTIFDD